MSLRDLVKPHFWSLYSKKIRAKLENPKYAGFFTPHDAESKGMRLVIGREGRSEEGSLVCLYWLVDEADGIIADAKFQCFGPTSLIAAAEIASELVLRKNYDQASRISADLIDQHVRDTKNSASFPEECNAHLNFVIAAIDEAVYQCRDIPFAVSYEQTPIAYSGENGLAGESIPGWEGFPAEQKRQIIEEVIDKEIRPYIELDAGGITVLALKEWEVLISYQGSCTSCHSATGSTLTAIQQILQTRVHPRLFVTPEL